VVNDMLKRIELILADTTHVVGGHVDRKVMHAIRSQYRQRVQPRLQQTQHHVLTTLKTDTKSYHLSDKATGRISGNNRSCRSHNTPIQNRSECLSTLTFLNIHNTGPETGKRRSWRISAELTKQCLSRS